MSAINVVISKVMLFAYALRVLRVTFMQLKPGTTISATNYSPIRNKSNAHRSRVLPNQAIIHVLNILPDQYEMIPIIYGLQKSCMIPTWKRVALKAIEHVFSTRSKKY